MVIWIIGLSGAGKTTLGRELVRQWRELQPQTVLVDGDEVREIFGNVASGSQYSIEARRKNAERITALCNFLDKQGINVVCCILSIFQEMRDENRKRFSNYYEIFMDASIEALTHRDPKGYYAAAQKGELKDLVGVDIPFERPKGSDLCIDTSSSSCDIEALAKEVLSKAKIQ